MSEQTLNEQTEVTQTETTTTQEPKLVPYEEMQRALSDLHKFKSETKKLQQELKQRQENELKSQQQWQTLAEQREKEVTDWRSKYEGAVSASVNEKKFNAVKDECAKLGLRAEAFSDLEMLDLNDLPVETTNTGKINVLHAKTFAERVKAMKPHWFGQPQVNLNTKSPGVGPESGPITVKDVYEAEKAYRKSGKDEDLKKYQDMHFKLRKQVIR